MKPYVPDSLPLDCLDVSKLIRRVGSANAAIARYDGLLQSVVNPSVMLSPLTQREAVLSSKIEGTQATVDEVLEYEAGIEFDPEKTNDIQEVVNGAEETEGRRNFDCHSRSERKSASPASFWGIGQPSRGAKGFVAFVSRSQCTIGFVSRIGVTVRHKRFLVAQTRHKSNPLESADPFF